VIDEGVEARGERIVIVADESLPRWQIANVAAILGATLGARGLVPLGHVVTDPDGEEHQAIVELTVPVLAATQAELPLLRRAALDRGLLVLDFNTAARDSSSYADYARLVAAQPPVILGMALHGPRRTVTSLVGNLRNLR
jgi:hypothetical protein